MILNPRAHHGAESLSAQAKAGVLPVDKPERRKPAERKPLRAVSEKRAASGEPVGLKRTGLSRVSDRRREERPRASTTLNRSTPLGHASKEQKAKVEREGPRIDRSVLSSLQLFKIDTFYGRTIDELGPTDPAHITPRPHGGCDDEICICPLPRFLHVMYDAGEFDLLPYLTLEEQAHAASHLGLLGALKRTTGETYVPEASGADG